MVGFLYVVTLLTSVAGGLSLLSAFSSAASAPQQAAAAAIGAALAVVPYVFTRCVQISVDRKERAAAERRTQLLLERIGDALKAPHVPPA